MGLFQDTREDAAGNGFVNLNDSAGTGLTSTLNAGKQSLDVNITGGSSSGAADRSAFTYGTTTETTIGGVFQDTSPTVTAGQQAAVRITAQRGMHINLRDSSGNELGNTAAAGVFVKPTDGTNSASFSATSEEFVQLRQGGNIANVNASNELLVKDTTADTQLTAINGKMSPATSTLSQVVLSTSSQTALASNASRKGMIFVNDNVKRSWIAFAATATTAAYTYKMQPNTTVENLDGRVYTGAVSVISETGVSGNLVITELT